MNCAATSTCGFTFQHLGDKKHAVFLQMCVFEMCQTVSCRGGKGETVQRSGQHLSHHHQQHLITHLLSNSFQKLKLWF